MTSCYFCTEAEQLEQHHIVPKRFGGGDEEENIVSVCPTCHRKLESLYDKRFYSELNVTKEAKQQVPDCRECGGKADGQIMNWYTLTSKFYCVDCAPRRLDVGGGPYNTDNNTCYE